MGGLLVPWAYPDSHGLKPEWPQLLAHEAVGVGSPPALESGALTWNLRDTDCWWSQANHCIHTLQLSQLWCGHRATHEPLVATARVGRDKGRERVMSQGPMGAPSSYSCSGLAPNPLPSPSSCAATAGPRDMTRVGPPPGQRHSRHPASLSP